MKVRLIMRNGISDGEGKCVGYDYITTVIEIPKEVLSSPYNKPEIIGGEWLDGE